MKDWSNARDSVLGKGVNVLEREGEQSWVEGEVRQNLAACVRAF
jgi:hypothetical protein